MESYHKPVLLKEVLTYLKVKQGGAYIDATVGGAGIGEAIVAQGGTLLGIDCDPDAISAAGRHLSSACPNASWRLAQGNFNNLKRLALKNGFSRVKGIIFDLGVSSYQLEKGERGFSFLTSGPLDMRMDPNLEITAQDLVNGLSYKELAKLFFELGEEYRSRAIAKAICQARRSEFIKTTGELADIIARAIPGKKHGSRIHPATRSFQALRIRVNNELENLETALSQAIEILDKKGRLVVISFHSGEDRIVKNSFKKAQEEGKLIILTKKPVQPSLNEIRENRRSRSSKLRAAEKI